MITHFSTLEEYATYLEGCSIEELKDIASFTDREKYPERYNLVLNRIAASATASKLLETTVTEPELVEATPEPKIISNWFKPPDVVCERRIHWSYIFFALSILVLYWLLVTVLGQLDTIKYRPWISWPIIVLITIIYGLSLLVYGIKACKKLEYWPLFTFLSPRKVVLEFFKSLLILIPVRIVIGLAILAVGLIINVEMTERSFIRFATYAPNSWIVFCWLLFAFTVGPAIEEIFFRGFLYNALKTRFSLAIACIAQAVIFTLYHRSDLLESLWIFLFGVALAIIYESRRNLLAPYFVHSISNAFFAIPLLLVVVANLHPVAKSFEEAANNPYWLVSSPQKYVEHKATGNEQWKYAIDTWGSKGKKHWKKEANAFQAVSGWFPDDRISSAKAKLGLVAIYRHYLRDYRRAIVAAKELRHKYPDQAEQYASALSHEGWSYYMLREFKNSRKAFIEVVEQHSEFNEAVESAKEGLNWLEAIEH
jgi:membrane protease YdiL (CAAX protease family)